MLTLGIDLSSQPKDTAACLIEWHDDGRAVVRDTKSSCDDDTLDALILKADAIGIDAPLGWPDAFVKAVGGWTDTKWDTALRDCLRLRLTDIEVRKNTKLTPLSVSTDRIALPAMRAMALLARHGVADRSGGDGKFFEVYPAGSLKQWGLKHSGYKGAENLPARRDLLTSLRKEWPDLRADDSFADSDHALDALVASLSAHEAAVGKSLRPSADQLATACREGWIHLPETGSA